MFIFLRRRMIKPSKFAQALDFSIESAAHVSKLIGKNITGRDRVWPASGSGAIQLHLRAHD